MQHVQPWKPSSIFHTSEAAATAAPAYAAASAAATGPGGAPPHKPSCSASASSAAGNVTLRTVALFGWRMGGTVRWSHWAAVQLAPAPALQMAATHLPSAQACGVSGHMFSEAHSLKPPTASDLMLSHASLASPAWTNPTNRCHWGEQGLRRGTGVRLGCQARWSCNGSVRYDTCSEGMAHLRRPLLPGLLRAAALGLLHGAHPAGQPAPQAGPSDGAPLLLKITSACEVRRRRCCCAPRKLNCPCSTRRCRRCRRSRCCRRHVDRSSLAAG